MADHAHAQIEVTCGSHDEARRIADRLVADRLAACVHLAEIDSVYEWESSVEHDREILLTAKTRRERFDAIVEVVNELHSYDLPAITMTALDGSEAYLAWIDEQTEPGAAAHEAGTA